MDELHNLIPEYFKSQSALARKLGVAKSTVSKWRNGTRYPKRTNLEQLKNLYEAATNGTKSPAGTQVQAEQTDTPSNSSYQE